MSGDLVEREFLLAVSDIVKQLTAVRNAVSSGSRLAVYTECEKLEHVVHDMKILAAEGGRWSDARADE